ncbi:MAG TPA: DUF2723 domain-containing protein [Gemmatimonadaceae bacterium]|nr:DUF2723 domain-containing protein [Gemmatimonadaceae bacterium]
MASASSYELDYRPSYVAAALAAAVVFLLYLLTLAPSTAMWDTSEYIAAAYVLGIPHPPGNPFFVLIGRVFSILPVASDVAMRVNILAALSSAVSAGMWFLITERVLVSWLTHRWMRIVGGAVAVLIGATAFTVWNQSVVNEKVYTVSLVGLAVICWLMIRWSDDPDGPKADRTLVLVAFLLGLGYSNHMAGFLAGPAVAAAILARRPQTLLRPKLLGAMAGVLLLGMTPFLTQPIRAAHFPAINEGEPTACVTELTAGCTFDRLTMERFEYNFNRGQYGKPSLLDRQAPFVAQLGMWWMYFRWQWLRDVHDEHPRIQRLLAVVFLVLGLFGGWVHWKRDRRSFWYFGTFMFSVTLLLIYYLNFKYGHSQAPELGQMVDREVRDRDYFYLFSFSSWSVWAALGLVFIWESLAAVIGADEVRLGRETVEQPRPRSWALAAPILLIAIIPLFTNWRAASRAGETFTRDFAHDLLNSVEPYGILVTVGDNDTFPLWYAQEVEGIRRDVIVANTSLLNTDWYTRQIIRRPVYEYDAEAGPAIYRDREWTKPSGPPLRLTFSEADAVPLYQQITQTSVFEQGSIRATINPRLLTRADLLVLQMIRDSYPERPVYFSRTSGQYGAELGFWPYLMTQGLARKLLPEVPSPGVDTLLLQGEGWMDVERTRVLWRDVFEAHHSIIRRGDWVDRASVGIPFLYVVTGGLLAEGLNRRGDIELAEQVMDTTEQLARATRLESIFAPMQQQRPLPLPGGDSPAPAALPPP